MVTLPFALQRDEMLVFVSSLSSVPPTLRRSLLYLISEYWHCLEMGLSLSYLSSEMFSGSPTVQRLCQWRWCLHLHHTMSSVKWPGPRGWEQHNTLQGAPHVTVELNYRGWTTWAVMLGDCNTSTISISPSPAFRINKGRQRVCGSLQQPTLQASLEEIVRVQYISPLFSTQPWGSGTLPCHFKPLEWGSVRTI